MTLHLCMMTLHLYMTNLHLYEMIHFLRVSFSYIKHQHQTIIYVNLNIALKTAVANLSVIV